MAPQINSIRSRNRQRGASFIETALLIPMLLLVCCGTMDFARVMYSGIDISNAARAGVQYGALLPGNAGDTGGMQKAALNDAADLGTSNVTATASNFCTCNGSPIACGDASCLTTPNGYVSVTTSYTFHTVVHYPGLPQSIVLTRTAKMRVQ